MVRVSFIVAGLLVVLGVGGYVITGAESKTALIPAAFGVVFAVLAWFARNPKLHPHMMHVAMLLALIGCTSLFMAAPKLLTMLGEGADAVERPNAVIAQLIMSVVCLVYLIMGINSFIQARRARQAEAGGNEASQTPGEG